MTDCGDQGFTLSGSYVLEVFAPRRREQRVGALAQDRRVALLRQHEEGARRAAPISQREDVGRVELLAQPLQPAVDLIRMRAIAAEVVVDHDRLAALNQRSDLFEIDVLRRPGRPDRRGLRLKPVVRVQKDQIAALYRAPCICSPATPLCGASLAGGARDGAGDEAELHTAASCK